MHGGRVPRARRELLREMETTPMTSDEIIKLMTDRCEAEKRKLDELAAAQASKQTVSGTEMVQLLTCGLRIGIYNSLLDAVGAPQVQVPAEPPIEPPAPVSAPESPPPTSPSTPTT